MTFEEIKDLIEKGGGKFLIVENGKPIFAAMAFEDYKKILERTGGGVTRSEKNEDGALPQELEKEPLKIEDLPI